MSRTRTVSAVLAATLIGSGAVSFAGWTIADPVNNSSFLPSDDIEGDGSCTSHPSSRYVAFGTDAGVEGHENVDSEQMMPGGPIMWSVTLSPDSPATEWNLSPTDAMGNPIGDHIFWVKDRHTSFEDAETNGHVVAEMP